MTKKFRPNQCPKCRHNNSDSACMRSWSYKVQSVDRRTDWAPFKGETNQKCGKFEPKKEATAK